MVKLAFDKVVPVNVAPLKLVGWVKDANVKSASKPTRCPLINFQCGGNNVGNSPVKSLDIPPLLTPVNVAPDKSTPVKSAFDKSALGPIRYPLIKFQSWGNCVGLVPVKFPLTSLLLTRVKSAPVKVAPVNVAPVIVAPVNVAPVKFARGPTKYPLINFHPAGNFVGLSPVTVPIISPLLTLVKVDPIKFAPLRFVPVKSASVKFDAPKSASVKSAQGPTKTFLINFQPNGKFVGVPSRFPLLIPVKVAPLNFTFVKVAPVNTEQVKSALVKSAPSPTRYPLINFHPVGNNVGLLPVTFPIILPLLTPVRTTYLKSAPVKSAPVKSTPSPIR